MSRKKQMIVTGKEDDMRPTRLSQILNEFDETAIYGTVDEDTYNSSLLEMNRADLENHAIKLGLVPVDGVERLRNILLAEFRSYVNSLYKPSHTSPTPKISDKVKKILAEGR